MPTIPSIRTSVENKSVLVLDEHAKNGTFQRDVRGRLIAYTGGFSVVFPYETSNGEKWAFRCWHSDINNSQKRYELISEAIKEANMDFLCGFEYIEKGINIEGKIYPTTRMRWIDGITIKDYICQNSNSKDILYALADKFLKMTRALHEKSLAHGDLQHGNILVGTDQKLYLVDYDSFYCPSLLGEEDTVTGLPDYQHPSRKSNKTITNKIDYFSELIIYLSILAVAEDSSLIEKYKVKDSDRLLFSREDFDDIKNSQIYKDILALGGNFTDLLNVLEIYLKETDIDSLHPFSNQIVENKVTLEATATKAIKNKQMISVYWQVPFDADVTLQQKGQQFTEKGIQGRINRILDEDTEFELTINTKDGILVKKGIIIQVFDECVISFSADKKYVFPSLPVKLTWNVTNAKKVWLGSEEVESSGSKIVEPTSDTVYILQASDEFGMKNQRLTIQTLPLKPMRLTISQPPNFVSRQVLKIQQPRYIAEVKFPHIVIDWIKVEEPRAPSFKDLGINVELSPPLPKVSLREKIIRVLNILNS